MTWQHYLDRAQCGELDLRGTMPDLHSAAVSLELSLCTLSPHDSWTQVGRIRHQLSGSRSSLLALSALLFLSAAVAREGALFFKIGSEGDWANCLRIPLNQEGLELDGVRLMPLRYVAQECAQEFVHGRADPWTLPSVSVVDARAPMHADPLVPAWALGLLTLGGGAYSRLMMARELFRWLHFPGDRRTLVFEHWDALAPSSQELEITVHQALTP